MLIKTGRHNSRWIDGESVSLLLTFLASLSFFSLDYFFLSRRTPTFQLKDFLMVLISYSITRAVLDSNLLQHWPSFAYARDFLTNNIAVGVINAIALIGMIIGKVDFTIADASIRASIRAAGIPAAGFIGFIAILVIVIDCLWLLTILSKWLRAK